MQNDVVLQPISLANRKSIPRNGFNYSGFLFPTSWKGYLLHELFEMKGGMPISRNEMGNIGSACIHYGDIHTSPMAVFDIQRMYDKLPKVPNDQINDRDLLLDGDIVFADASEDYDGIGKSIVVDNPKRLPVIGGLHTIIASDKTKLIDKKFKKYLFSNWLFRKQIMFYAQGISVYGISKGNLDNVIVTLPPIEEQKKIADLLSTWDDDIEIHRKLIKMLYQEKRHYQRKFIDRIVPQISLHELAKIKVVKIVDASATDWGKNDLIYLSTSSIEENEIVSNEGYVSETNRPMRAQLPALKNSVWFAKMENTIKVLHFLNSENYVLSTGFFGFVPDEIRYHGGYLTQVFLSKGFNVQKDQLCEGSSQSGLKSTHLEELYVPFPSFEDQKSFSRIFDLIDKEIFLLKKKSNNLLKQKQGLMQQLLTGKIRAKASKEVKSCPIPNSMNEICHKNPHSKC